MISLPKRPTERIIIAIAFSLAAHIAILLTKPFDLPRTEPLLPPLIARLEPLLVVMDKPASKSEPKPRPTPRQEPVISEKQPADSSPLPESRVEEPQIDPASLNEQATEEPQIDPEPQPEPETEPPIAEEPIKEPSPLHPLPKQAELVFAVSKGNGFNIGESRHRLEIGKDKAYKLKVSSVTTGLAGLLKTFELEQQSNGLLTDRGLRPDQFSETKHSSKGKEQRKAGFDWQNNRLSFLHGGQTPLPEQAQDIISFLYQLSQLPLNNEIVQIHISNGKKLERYELAIGKEEEIETPLGKLRTLPLRKIHAPNEEGVEVWLGLEYRLLPVKIRHIDRTGGIAGEMVISDIRVADE